VITSGVNGTRSHTVLPRAELFESCKTSFRCGAEHPGFHLLSGPAPTVGHRIIEPGLVQRAETEASTPGPWPTPPPGTTVSPGQAVARPVIPPRQWAVLRPASERKRSQLRRPAFRRFFWDRRAKIQSVRVKNQRKTVFDALTQPCFCEARAPAPQTPQSNRCGTPTSLRRRSRCQRTGSTANGPATVGRRETKPSASSVLGGARRTRSPGTSRSGSSRSMRGCNEHARACAPPGPRPGLPRLSATVCVKLTGLGGSRGRAQQVPTARRNGRSLNFNAVLSFPAAGPRPSASKQLVAPIRPWATRVLNRPVEGQKRKWLRDHAGARCRPTVRPTSYQIDGWGLRSPPPRPIGRFGLKPRSGPLTFREQLRHPVYRTQRLRWMALPCQAHRNGGCGPVARQANPRRVSPPRPGKPCPGSPYTRKIPSNQNPCPPGAHASASVIAPWCTGLVWPQVSPGTRNGFGRPGWRGLTVGPPPNLETRRDPAASKPSATKPPLGKKVRLGPRLPPGPPAPLPDTRSNPSRLWSDFHPYGSRVLPCPRSLRRRRPTCQQRQMKTPPGSAPPHMLPATGCEVSPGPFFPVAPRTADDGRRKSPWRKTRRLREAPRRDRPSIPTVKPRSQESEERTRFVTVGRSCGRPMSPPKVSGCLPGRPTGPPPPPPPPFGGPAPPDEVRKRNLVGFFPPPGPPRPPSPRCLETRKYSDSKEESAQNRKNQFPGPRKSHPVLFPTRRGEKTNTRVWAGPNRRAPDAAVSPPMPGDPPNPKPNDGPFLVSSAFRVSCSLRSGGRAPPAGRFDAQDPTPAPPRRRA